MSTTLLGTKPPVSKPDAALIEALGEREQEVPRLVAEGLSNEAVGAKLFISVGTVKWYLNGITTNSLSATAPRPSLAPGSIVCSKRISPGASFHITY